MQCPRCKYYCFALFNQVHCCNIQCRNFDKDFLQKIKPAFDNDTSAHSGKFTYLGTGFAVKVKFDFYHVLDKNQEEWIFARYDKKVDKYHTLHKYKGQWNKSHAYMTTDHLDIQAEVINKMYEKAMEYETKF